LRAIPNDEQLTRFGWRIPFFSGFRIAFVAMYLRMHGDDIHINANVYDHQDSVVKNPIAVAFRRGNRLALLSNSLVPMLWGADFYVSFVWMAIFLDNYWRLLCPMPFG
jgi:MHS family proline/betaine transporter-like MFS transporter